MPNHIHGILIVVDAPVGTPLAGVQNIINENCDVFINENCDETIGAGASPARTTIGDIVGAYKSLVFNACLDIYKSKNERMGKLWLRNYYEIIIRNEFSYQNISNYIINNPAKWKEDKFNK
jgi:REP element-mobilizing transposase RayT